MYCSSWAHCGFSFLEPDKFGHLIFGTREEAQAINAQKRKEELAAIEAKIKSTGLTDQFTMQLRLARESNSYQAIKDLRDEIDMLVALKLVK